MKPIRNILLFTALLGIVLLALGAFTGCAALDPGADPVVVRAEQTLTISAATFDTFLKLDAHNLEFARSNAPAAHAFAEWLRSPVGDPPQPRGIAILHSADAVKQAYKHNRTPENKASLITAIATVESAMAQTQNYLNSVKP